MFRELIDAIQAGVKAEVIPLNGINYSTKPLKPFGEKNFAAIEVKSLDALVTYAATQKDGIELAYFVIESPTYVYLINSANAIGERNTPIVAQASIPKFNFGEYYEQEAFRIALATNFVQTDERDNLLDVISKIEAGTVRESEDDGISQSVAMKKSVRMVSRGNLNPTQILVPYRTFGEVEQPASEFLLRLKDADSGVRCGLFVADGGQWENEARKSIAQYLESKETNIPILM